MLVLAATPRTIYGVAVGRIASCLEKVRGMRAPENPPCSYGNGLGNLGVEDDLRKHGHKLSTELSRMQG